MQKIEKWRIQELALVLKELANLLREGSNPEWANVFSHFHDESQKIISKKEFDLGLLVKLIHNTRNCFTEGHSFLHIELQPEDPRVKERMNQDMRLTRALLLQILSDLEQRSVESIN